MKRKILTLVLASTAVLSLAGCSLSTQPTTIDPNVDPTAIMNPTKLTEYDVQSILEKCNLADKDEFSEDGNTWYYDLTSHEPDEYDIFSYSRLAIFEEDNEYVGYEFYIYESEEEAEKALKDHTKNRYKKDKDGFIKDDHYVGGWEDGIMDASIRTFEYQTGNLIVEYRDECIGMQFHNEDEWEKWKAEYDANEEQRENEIATIHEKIMNEW